MADNVIARPLKNQTGANQIDGIYDNRRIGGSKFSRIDSPQILTSSKGSFNYTGDLSQGTINASQTITESAILKDGPAGKAFISPATTTVQVKAEAEIKGIEDIQFPFQLYGYNTTIKTINPRQDGFYNTFTHQTTKTVTPNTFDYAAFSIRTPFPVTGYAMYTGTQTGDSGTNVPGFYANSGASVNFNISVLNDTAPDFSGITAYAKIQTVRFDGARYPILDPEDQ